MKESAQAPLSLIKARAATLEIGPEVFEKSDIHVHVPAGATPKDGPSAGEQGIGRLKRAMKLPYLSIQHLHLSRGH